MKPALVLTLTCLLSINTCQAKGITCSAFPDQAAAQRYYDTHQPGWKRLDRDKDGEPCECLKGGSKYGESICTRWREKYGK